MAVQPTVATMFWSSMITKPTKVKPNRTICNFNPVMYSAFSGSFSVSLFALDIGIGGSGVEAIVGAGCDGTFTFNDNEA